MKPRDFIYGLITAGWVMLSGILVASVGGPYAESWRATFGFIGLVGGALAFAVDRD